MGRAGNRCGFSRFAVPPDELQVNRAWSRANRDTRQEAAKRRKHENRTEAPPDQQVRRLHQHAEMAATGSPG
jgi:hypothetical protein